MIYKVSSMKKKEKNERENELDNPMRNGKKTTKCVEEMKKSLD